VASLLCTVALLREVWLDTRAIKTIIPMTKTVEPAQHVRLKQVESVSPIVQISSAGFNEAVWYSRSSTRGHIPVEWAQMTYLLQLHEAHRKNSGQRWVQNITHCRKQPVEA
jgi:hypothetical protein